MRVRHGLRRHWSFLRQHRRMLRSCPCATGYVHSTSPASATRFDCVSIGGCIGPPPPALDSRFEVARLADRFVGKLSMPGSVSIRYLRDGPRPSIADGPSNCDTNAACNDTAGSFTCACSPGYSGDGISCSQCVAGDYKSGTGTGDFLRCGSFSTVPTERSWMLLTPSTRDCISQSETRLAARDTSGQFCEEVPLYVWED